MSKEKKGISGLLLLPAIIVVANPVMSLLMALANAGFAFMITQGKNPLAIVVFAWLLAPAGLALFIYSIIVAIHFFKKTQGAPSKLTSFILLALGYLSLEAVVLTVGKGTPMLMTGTEMLVYIVPSAITLLIWLVYSKNSSRVENTFVN